jgi:hypothetical protein
VGTADLRVEHDLDVLLRGRADLADLRASGTATGDPVTIAFSESTLLAAVSGPRLWPVLPHSAPLRS